MSVREGDVSRETMLAWWMDQYDRIAAQQIAAGGDPLVVREELVEALESMDYWNMRHTYDGMIAVTGLDRRET